MIKLDYASIQKIAQLARIKIADEEIDAYQQELSSIMNLIQKIQNINTDGIKPMAHPSNTAQRMREDQ